MDLHTALHGLFVPLVTPFAGNGRLAGEALDKLARNALDQGASGLVALGTTAETASLSADEKRTVVDICASVCRERRVPLIVGAGSNDTGSTVDSLCALTPEADAALVPVPCFTRPGEAGVYAHFAEVSARSPVPVIVYNIPYRTGQVVRADTLRRLAQLPGIAGVKQATGGIDSDTADLLSDPPPDFAVLAGDDVFAPALLALGAAGGILASANVCPDEFARLVSAWERGDVARARELGRALTRLSAALFAEPNPTVIKAVLHAQGRIPGAAVRLPLLPAGDRPVEHALSCLRSLDG